MLKPVEWRFVRVSTTTTIGLVVIIGAACGLGAAAVAGSRHGLVARYYANPEWRGAPVVEGRDQRITTGALDERVMAIPDAADGGFSARWQGFLRVDQPAAFFLAVFLIKYRVEFLLALPLFAALFTVYLWIALKPTSSAMAPV